jgi:hypothetical protein
VLCEKALRRAISFMRICAEAMIHCPQFTILTLIGQKRYANLHGFESEFYQH